MTELTKVDVYVTGAAPTLTLNDQGQFVTAMTPIVYYVSVVVQNYQASPTTSASSGSDSGGGLSTGATIMIVMLSVFIGGPIVLGILSSCCN
jgi:hypothetical protein